MREVFDDRLSGLVGLAGEAEEARGAFMSHEHGLTIFSEEHEIGFPVAGERAVVGLRGRIVNGDAVGKEVDGTAPAAAAQTAAARLMAGRGDASAVVVIAVVLWLLNAFSLVHVSVQTSRREVASASARRLSGLPGTWITQGPQQS